MRLYLAPYKLIAITLLTSPHLGNWQWISKFPQSYQSMPWPDGTVGPGETSPDGA